MIAMTMIIAIAFAMAREWFSERLETRQRPKMAMTVTAAFAVFQYQAIT